MNRVLFVRALVPVAIVGCLVVAPAVEHVRPVTGHVRTYAVGDYGYGVPTAFDVTACGYEHEVIYDPDTDIWTCES